jgi:hypothetical protein
MTRLQAIGEWFSSSGHLREDVDPFEAAERLDRYFGTGNKYKKQYLKARPPNNGKNCPENIVNDP